MLTSLLIYLSSVYTHTCSGQYISLSLFVSPSLSIPLFIYLYLSFLLVFGTFIYRRLQRSQYIIQLSRDMLHLLLEPKLSSHTCPSHLIAFLALILFSPALYVEQLTLLRRLSEEIR